MHSEWLTKYKVGLKLIEFDGVEIFLICRWWEDLNSIDEIYEL
jgi:hypothetical protein